MTKPKVRSAPIVAEMITPADHSCSGILTLDDRLERIRKLGNRIEGYIQFMCSVSTMRGTSEAAKNQAVAAFHECLHRLEERLGRIQDDLRLE